MLARWLPRHPKVSRPGRIGDHICCRSQLLYWHTQSARLALQSKTDQIHGIVQRQHICYANPLGKAQNAPVLNSSVVLNEDKSNQMSG